MKITRSFRIQGLILAAALSIGLGFVFPVSAQTVHSYILDSNGKGPNSGRWAEITASPMGIKDAGQVVGQSFTAEGAPHAFITGPNEVGMTDLNSLLESPAGIV